MTSYQPLPDNPPTNTSGTDYYAHRKIIYAALNTFIPVPKPTGLPAQDTQSIQTAIDAAIAGGKGRIVVLHPGTYVVNQTITIRNVAGLHIIGNGATVIQSSASPAIKMAHVRESVLDGFALNVAAGNIGIQCLRDNNPAGLSPTQNTFRNLLIENGAFSVVLGGTGMVDANNDFNLFENAVANNYTNTGFSIQGSQSYGNIFRNCKALGAVGASYGVDCGGAGGSFAWYGGGTSRNAADFRMGRHYQPYIIENAICENSQRFIERVNSAWGALIVRGCRWSGNAIHADGRAIITSGQIDLHLEMNRIGDGGADIDIFLDFGANTHNRIKMDANWIFSTATNVFPNAVPDTLIGNKKCTNEGLLTVEALTG